MYHLAYNLRASQVALLVRNLPANVSDMRDTGLIPEFRNIPGDGNGSLLQYSCLRKIPWAEEPAGYSHDVANSQA